MDFGFNDEKFKGEANIVPYAQFINPTKVEYFGLAVRHECAEQAQFKPTVEWLEVDHQFKGAKQREKLWLCVNPRLVILARSKPYMSDGDNVVAYDAKIKASGNWKAFSYAIVLFLDENNQPISELPFRLKCSGFAGMTFIKGYSYYQNTDSFTNRFLKVYQELSGDKTPKNDLFFAHAVYQPLFVMGEAKNAAGESSDACITESFEIPTKENFSNFIIPWNRGSKRNPISETIVRLQEESETWIKLEKVSEEYEEHSDTSSEEQSEKQAWIRSIKEWLQHLDLSIFTARNLLNSRYNKNSSSELSLEELIDFHNFLKEEYKPVVQEIPDF